MTARWLDGLEAALDAADRPCPFFFRDDDAGWDHAGLGALLDVFDRHDVPIDVAVIPAEIDPLLARDLLTRARRSPVRLHQHGYAHANHESTGRKCEFGTARSAAELNADISAGRQRMLDWFGQWAEPTFTPPWNRCTPETAEVLVDVGIRVLSGDATATPFGRADLAEVPVTVDWMGHRKGVRWTRAELAQRLADDVIAGGPVGVMLHHQVADATEREVVASLLAMVAAHPAARPTTIARLAGAVLGDRAVTP